MFTDRLRCLCHIYKRNPLPFPPVQAGIRNSQHVANPTSHRQLCKFNQRNCRDTDCLPDCQEEAKRQRRARKVWVRFYLTECSTHGHYECLMRVLSRDDPELYRNFLRMNETLFHEFVERIKPRLTKQCTFWRKPLDVELRLAITLKFSCIGLLL